MPEHQPPVELPEGYLEFFVELESWQNEESIRLKKHYTPAKLDLGKLLARGSRPLLQQVEWEMDAGSFKNAYADLLDFLKKRRPYSALSTDKIKAGLDSLDFVSLCRAFLQGDDDPLIKSADQLNIPLDFFLFTLDHTLRPFLRILAEPYAVDIASEGFTWAFPTICPVCGGKSHISRLAAENGQRFMFCDRCFTEWKVRYLYCVYCGHDHPGDINCLTVEGDAAYRVYVCENCKGYLKTYDERLSGRPTDLFIANMETIYLDMLAAERGYNNHDAD